MITLTLPRPPSVNALFRNIRGKGRVKTERYRTWLRAAMNEILAQKPQGIEGPYVVEIRVDKGRADLDNLAKGPLDLLVKCGVTEDDKHLMKLTMVHQPGQMDCTVRVEAA